MRLLVVSVCIAAASGSAAATAAATTVAAPTTLVDGNTLEVFSSSPAGHLLEFTPSSTNPGMWNEYDITTASAGPAITGRPEPILDNGTLSVFADIISGHLLQTTPNSANGKLWNAYDITAASGGPTITASPALILYNGGLNVFTNTSNGHLLQTIPNSANGKLWNAYDITSISAGPPVSGDPAPIVGPGGSLGVFTTDTNSGDTMQFTPDPTNGLQWDAYDIDTEIAPPAAGGTTTTGVGSGTLSTTTPRPHRGHLRVKLLITWKYTGTRTRLISVKALGLPGDAHITARCTGHGCPRPSARTAAAPRVKRLWRELAGQTLRAGDRETFTIAAPGRSAERIGLRIRANARPLARVL